MAAVGWRVVVVSAGRAGRDGSSHRVHALAPWILLTAPWVKGDSPSAYMKDLETRGAGHRRAGLAEVLAEESHAAARDLREVLGLAAIEEQPVALPGDTWPRGLRCLPARKGWLLAPLLAEAERRGVRLVERTLAIGLLTAGERTAGVLALDRARGTLRGLSADVVVLACGGAGAVFPCTTSARWCRGSGLALAGAAGALLHHPRLTQALPVTATPPLYFPTTAALLSGRILVDGRALPPYPDLDAATADIARALLAGSVVVLDPVGDGRSPLPVRVRESPTFKREGRVPLTIAVHHSTGGVAIDEWGRTSLPGLYACGEAAGGVQGMKRTMGTGLLEARIFGRRAGRAAVKDIARLEAAPVAEGTCTPSIPLRPDELEGRLDALLAPLAVERPLAAVEPAIAELSSWPRNGSAAADERSGLAAIRLAAALAILQPLPGGSPAEGRETPGGRVDG
jgi:aspartate oxidase